MTRKQRRLTMIAGALAVLAVAAALVLNAMRSSIMFFTTPGKIAEQHIAPGTKFRLGGLVEKGSLVRGGFVAGEPIREDRLALPGAGFLSGQLPSGKRAIAVRVTAESAAGGFILPNDRVDLIHTSVISGQSGGEQVSSRTILSNIRVLAVDQNASGESDGEAVVAKTATLEVEPDQIPVVTAAEASGTISLALRAASDEDEPAAAVQAGKHTKKVRIFGGATSRTVEVPSFAHEGS